MTEAFVSLYDRLRAYPQESDSSHWRKMADEAYELILASREADNSTAANRAWHLVMVASARSTMCEIFVQLRDGEFRSAWVALERVEKMVEALQRNAILDDEFFIDELGEMVAAWQALFPYTVFASPEMLIKRQECTICDSVVSPLRPCGHLPGVVYNGELCSRRITELEPISIALVRDPVQKYSVLIPAVDPHDYARLRFVVDRLRGSFSRWRLIQTTAMHDHSLFDNWAKGGDCPCHSGWRYEDCCVRQPGVRLPHDQIIFEEPPATELPNRLVRRRTHANGDMEDVEFTPKAA